jgi:hypothetical protein
MLLLCIVLYIIIRCMPIALNADTVTRKRVNLTLALLALPLTYYPQPRSTMTEQLRRSAA